MKSVAVPPRSGFPIKDGSEYLLILISFSRLLIAVRLIAPFGLKNTKEQHKLHEIKRFTHQPC